MKKYDIVVVGSGPAGLFTVNELIKENKNLNIAIFEKGEIRKLDDKKASPNCGFGGAGSFSDGKLILSSEVGGNLNEIMSDEDFNNTMNEMVDIYKEYSDNTDNIRDFECEDQEKIKELQYKAIIHDMKLYSYKLKHFGTDNLFYIIENMRKRFEDCGVEMNSTHEIKDIKNRQWICFG